MQGGQSQGQEQTRPGERKGQAQDQSRPGERKGQAQDQKQGQPKTTGQGKQEGQAQRDQGQSKSDQGQSKSEQGQSKSGQSKSDQSQSKSGQSGESKQGQTGQSQQGQQDRTQQGQSREQGQSGQRQGSQSGSSTSSSSSASFTTEQRTKIRETVLRGGNAPRVTNVNFSVRVGTVVPTSVRVVEVPQVIVEVHPEWRGFMYFVYNDEIIIVDKSHKIVAVIEV